MGERIIDRLNDAARQGNIDIVYDLIQENVKLLEEIDELPFVDTPLHVAASAGGTQHILFATEMMRLKPSFSWKPDLKGNIPIHLALAKGHTQMVRGLLQVDGDLVRVKGKWGRTPLHEVAAFAATEQQLALIDKVLSDCPNSIEDVTIKNQTALHIALVENHELVAFKRLVKWLRKNKSENAREILNRQDGEGNTVLHVAVSKNETEAVRELLNCGVNLNARNLEGHTAQDILQERRQVNNSEIRDLLFYAGVLSCSCSFLPNVNCYEYCIRTPMVLFYERSRILRNSVLFVERLRLLIETAREGSRISNDDRNALLVVAALFITIAYQVVLSPPGGIWQEDHQLSTPEPSSISPGPAQAPAPAPALDFIWHTAGKAIAETTAPTASFNTIAVINCFTFTLSAIMTFVLLPSGYISVLFRIALVQLWVSYYYSWGVIVEALAVRNDYLYVTGLCFVLFFFVFFGKLFCGGRIMPLYLQCILSFVYTYLMLRNVNLL